MRKKAIKKLTSFALFVVGLVIGAAANARADESTTTTVGPQVIAATEANEAIICDFKPKPSPTPTSTYRTAAEQREDALIAQSPNSAYAQAVLRARSIAQDPNLVLTAEQLQQKKSLCDAAKLARQNRNSNRDVSGAWSGVAIVCGAACVSPIIGNGVCYGGALGATVFESSKAQEAQDLGKQLMSYAPMMMSAGSGGGIKGLGGKKTDGGTCLAAAYAVIQSSAKRKAAGELQKTYETSLAQAAALTGSPVQTTVAMGGASQVAQSYGSLTESNPSGGSLGGLGTTGSVGALDSGGVIASGSVNQGSGDLCSKSGDAATLGDSTACARASDKSLPKFYGSDAFYKEVAKATGNSPRSLYGAGGLSPQSIAQGISNGGAGSSGSGSGSSGLSASGLKGLSATLANAMDAATYGGQDSSSTYARARGGSPSQASDDHSENSGLEKLMEGLLGKDGAGKDGKTQSAVSQIEFMNQNRSPAAIAEDRRISIFDRVSFRYGRVGRAWAQP